MIVGLIGMLIRLGLSEAINNGLELRRQWFVMKSVIHRPQPLPETVSIRAAEPWFMVSERAGQQLHGMSCCSKGKCSHVVPLTCRSQSLA